MGRIQETICQRTRSQTDLIKQIQQETKKGKVTLLRSAKDNEHNNAVALNAVLEKKLA